jgi:AraC family transcriptional activator of pobA
MFVQYPLYTVVSLKEGVGIFKADARSFYVKAPAMIFATPIQTLQLKGPGKMSMLQFHGDYYCIEYHRKDVACNSILFNNIYTDTSISLKSDTFAFFKRIVGELDNEMASFAPSETVISTLIQLLLAKAATLKSSGTILNSTVRRQDEKMELFRNLVDRHFLFLRKPSAYAKLLHISPEALTKHCKLYFRMTPSRL